MAACRRHGSRAILDSALPGRAKTSRPEPAAVRTAHHHRCPPGGNDASQKGCCRAVGRTPLGLQGVKENPPRSILPVRERLSFVARATEPILNRVFLVGPPVVDLLMTDQAVRVPELTFAADSCLQLLSTSMVDRLGGDLQRLGLSRIGRAVNADRWRVSDDVTIDLVQVRADDGDPEQVWLEYATLLTLPFTVDKG